MSDTPETDKQSFVAEHNEGRELVVEAWFCEIMERKRDAAIADLNILCDKVLELNTLLEGQQFFADTKSTKHED